MNETNDLFPPHIWPSNEDLFQFSDNRAALLRNEAIDRVIGSNNHWIDQCIAGLPFFMKRDFTGEDLRHFFESKGIRPNSPKAWGALVNTLIRRKLIRRTGERRHMRDSQSHARMTDVYNRT